MLDALRKGAGTWLAKLFIALLIFSFAIWGVSGFLTGVGQNTVAKVGEAEVSLLQFDRTYRQELNRFGQQIGRPLTPAEGASLGIPQQTLGRLIADATVSDSATKLKLAISDAELSGIIQADPAFRGASGRYDRGQLQYVLRNIGYSEDEYVNERRQIAARGQLVEALTGGMAAPEAYAKVLDNYQSETRAVDYYLLTESDIDPIPDPTDEQLTSFYDEKKSDFRAPEYRKVDLLTLEPSSLARPEDVVDEDAIAEYERRSNDFFQPERRTIRQLSFSSVEEAEKAVEDLKGGKTFEDIMSERGLQDSDVSLGTKSREDLLDEAVSEAAFSLNEGETSGVVDGRFSTVVLQVQEILPEATQPFEEVREIIVTDLATEQAEREILDILDEVEDARAGGDTLEMVSERFSLELEKSAAFDNSGNTMEGSSANLPDAQGLIAGAFDSDVGIENDVVQYGDQGFLWYEVTEVTPARDRELDEVRSDVISAWKAVQLSEKLDEVANEMLEKANTGTPFDLLALANGLDLKTIEGLQRNRPDGDFGREAVTASFSGPTGSNRVANSADGSARLILNVKQSEVPDFDNASPEATALNGQIAQQLQSALLGQYIADIEQKTGVEINNAAVDRVINPSPNSHYGM